MSNDFQVHIAGVGDYSLAGVTALSDPCPLPSAAKKKGLRDKEKLFHAPMSGIGELLYDKDAVYININDHLVQFSKADDGKGEPTNKGYLQGFASFIATYLFYIYLAVASLKCLAHFVFISVKNYVFRICLHHSSG